MRKLFKKSLACVLAVALCLTAMVGVLSVSADVTGTLEVQAFNSNVGENPYVIATFASADANELISEAFIKVEGASIATVAPVEGATGFAVELNEDKDIFNINSDNGVATAAVKVVLNVAEVGEYTIKFTDVTSATDSQQLITFPTVEATVAVVVPHVHTLGYIDNGNGTHTTKCAADVCDGTFVPETVACSYVDGYCVCGAAEPVSGPVLDTDLQFRDINVTVTDTVNIRYRVYKDTTKGINGYATLGYDHVEVVVYGKEYSFVNGDTLYNEVDIAETTLVTEPTSTGSNHFFNGIAMISLGLNIDAYIKAYDAEGNYVAYSPVTTTSPEGALKTNLENTKTDTGKATIIELLNMAAAAQIKFAADKAGTDLATAVAEGKLVNKDLPASIVTDLPVFNTADGVAKWADDVTAEFQTAHKVSVAVPITASPGIRIYVGGRTTLDVSKLRVEFSYYDPNPSVKDTVVKTVEGVNASVSGARLAFNIPSLEFHNANAIVTASVVYEGKVIATLDYSIETFIEAQLAEGSTSSQPVKDLAAAIAKFGLAFRMNKGIA